MSLRDFLPPLGNHSSSSLFPCRRAALLWLGPCRTISLRPSRALPHEELRLEARVGWKEDSSLFLSSAKMHCMLFKLCKKCAYRQRLL